MKKIIISFIILVLLLTGCTNSNINKTKINLFDTLNISSLDDPELITFIEEDLYGSIIDKLDSDKYFVENVQANYVSKEYFEESKNNSQSNIYFGYSLEQINSAFGDSKFIFTVDENGNTTVEELVEITDSFDQIIQNVMIGSGVILICVTVSLVTAPTAPAISLIFASSAKTASSFAISGATFDAVVSAAITGYETGDLEKTMKASLISASEGFKWGAISGSVVGGVSNTISLKGATRNGLTMNQAASIQKESKLPLDLIKNIHSFDEYNVYKNVSLDLKKVNGKNALVQSIDWNYVGDVTDGRTNIQRVMDGYAPLDKSGNSYEIHHIGQKNDGPLAILTKDQHKNNFEILHANTGIAPSEIDRSGFNNERKKFWKDLAKQYLGGNE